MLAATRWSFWADRHRLNTASPMSVSGMPCSVAASTVHLPVPFCPAVSRITSTVGLPVSGSTFLKMSAVISIRYESSTPVFHLL